MHCIACLMKFQLELKKKARSHPKAPIKATTNSSKEQIRRGHWGTTAITAVHAIHVDLKNQFLLQAGLAAAEQLRTSPAAF